jgi:pimeloyl-ACP methyl ester carboxylesterase
MPTRHFVTVGDRQVHYRRAGSGPPVVLLHQTPQSSITMAPLMQRLADRFTAIALDSPGYGLSDPLPAGEHARMDHTIVDHTIADHTIADLADALAATLDALGIATAAFAGQHTGAAIIAAFLQRYPERASAATLDGYTVFSREEAQTMLPHYQTPWSPSWDGGHLAWAWARLRDGWMFFPWRVRTRATRRDLDMPPPEQIHRDQLMEMLRSADAYRATYRAVFAFDGAATIGSLRQPVAIACREEDQLYAHLDRLPPLPPNVGVHRLPARDYEGTWSLQRAFLLEHAPPTSTPTIPPVEPLRDRPFRDYLPARDGTMRLLARIAGTHVGAAAAPIVLLHGAGESSAAFASVTVALSRHRTVIALDLPGHGDSDPAPEGYDPATIARDVVDALHVHGLPPFELFGCGLGAAVAIEIALAEPASVRRVTCAELLLLDPIERDDLVKRYAPPIEPRWDGTHLLSLWHQLRDRQFFWPWYRRTRAGIRPIEPGVDADDLQRQLFDALRCHDYSRAHRDAWTWPAAAQTARLGVPFRYLATPADVWARDAERLAALAPRGRSVLVDVDDPAVLAGALVED